MNGSLELANESVLLSVYASPASENTTVEPLSAFTPTKIFFYFVILLCTTVGNIMVVYVICTSRKMRSQSNYLILNLAICDLLTPLISIPFDFALEENKYVWMYGRLMCKILYPGATLTTTASSLTLAAISLDRYRIIMHPFKTRLSSRQIKFIIFGIYVFTISAVFPYAYILHLESGSCKELWPRFLYRKLYTMALFLIQYALPLIFMIVMYAVAIKNLYSASDKMRNNSIHTATLPRRWESEQGSDTEQKPRRCFHLCGQKEEGFEENPNARATKMFMAVVAVFAVFMFPNQVLWIWADYGNGADQSNFPKLSIICWLFTYTNGVVNPVIFAIFSKEFRNGFKDLFKLVFCCGHAVLATRIGRFEFLTRTGSSSSHSAGEASHEKFKAYKQDTKQSESAVYYVEDKLQYTRNSLTETTTDRYPTRHQDKDILNKSEVDKSVRLLKVNYVCDNGVQAPHGISARGSYGQEHCSCSVAEPERLSRPLFEGSHHCPKPLYTDENVIDNLPLKRDLETPLEFIDEKAIQTLTELPETDC